jgi:hypothetical protein
MSNFAEPQKTGLKSRIPYTCLAEEADQTSRACKSAMRKLALGRNPDIPVIERAVDEAAN